MVETIRREVYEKELAWLAGILDGEGYMIITNAIKPHKEKKGGRTIGKSFSHRVCVGMSNTDMRMVQKVSEIWSNLDVRYWYQLTSHKKTYPNSKMIVSIQATGYRNIVKLLTPLLPYLVNKKDQAEKLLEYCKLRLENYSRERMTKEYGIDLELHKKYVEELRQLKQQYVNPSTTARRASQALSW